MSDKHYIERYWRDATPADAIKEPPMVARFQNESLDYWEYDGWLVGWDRTDEYKWRSSCECYKQCQVYDAPDPGEGWRLIDVEKEQPQVGDEVYEGARDRWYVRLHTKPYDKTIIYRRRIEQPKPEPKYVPFTWEDREELRGRWVRCVDVSDNEWAITSMYIGGGGELRANGTHADRLLSGFVFVDTKEPVGRKVTE